MSPGSIGITLRKYNADVLKGLGLNGGVIVDNVNKGGPADKAGIKPEDVIVAINGKPVKDGDDLVQRISGTPIGDQVTITVDRNGKKVDSRVTIADRDEQRLISTGFRKNESGESVEKPDSGATNARFGLRIRPTNESERESAAIDKGGVVVTTVDESSFADEVGLLEKDIIVSINRQPVNSIEDVRSIQGKLKPGDAVAFRIMRPVPVSASPRQQGKSGGSYVGTYIAGTLPKQ